MGRALVTGCAKGVGLATAVALAGQGWDVVATMRDPSTRSADLRTAAAAAGVNVTIAELDVSDDASVTDAIQSAGALDLLVNNAAVAQFCSVEETPIKDWQMMLDTNFLGPVRCMRAVLPSMRRQGHGCIINVSTVAAQVPFPGTGAYAASKAALEHASAVTAVEARPHGIRVILLEAGSLATGMQASGTSASPESPFWPTIANTVHYLSANRAAATDPRTVGAAVVHLASQSEASLRIPVGQAAAETLALSQQLGHDGWQQFIADPAFAERYQAPPRIE